MPLAPHIPQPIRLGLAFPAVVLGLPVLAGLGWLGADRFGAVLLPLLALGMLLLVDLALAARRKRAACEALAVLASAARRGVPLDRACFAAGADGPGGGGRRARRQLLDLGTALLHGDPLAAAMDRHLPLLPPGDRNAVRVAERRGDLPATLGRLAERRRRVLLGPEFGVGGPPAVRVVAVQAAVLAVFLAAAWVFTALLVAPMMIEVAADYGQPVPAVTRWFFPVDATAPRPGPVARGLAAVAFVALLLALFTVVAARILPGADARRSPLSGLLGWLWPPERHAAWSAAFATLAASLGAGLDLPEALRDAADATASPVARRRLRRLAARHGDDPDAGFRGLPRLARGVLAGPAGARPASAALLAEACAEKADASAAALGALLQPAVVVLAAAPVLLFCLALFLPMVGILDTLILEVWP